MYWVFHLEGFLFLFMYCVVLYIANIELTLPTVRPGVAATQCCDSGTSQGDAPSSVELLSNGAVPNWLRLQVARRCVLNPTWQSGTAKGWNGSVFFLTSLCLYSFFSTFTFIFIFLGGVLSTNLHVWALLFCLLFNWRTLFCRKADGQEIFLDSAAEGGLFF